MVALVALVAAGPRTFPCQGPAAHGGGLWVAVTIGILAAWLAFKIVAAQGMAVAARSGFSEAATTAIFDGALGPMKGPALALAIVGMVIAILAWVTAQGAEES